MLKQYDHAAIKANKAMQAIREKCRLLFVKRAENNTEAKNALQSFINTEEVGYLEDWYKHLAYGDSLKKQWDEAHELEYQMKQCFIIE